MYNWQAEDRVQDALPSFPGSTLQAEQGGDSPGLLLSEARDLSSLTHLSRKHVEVHTIAETAPEGHHVARRQGTTQVSR